MFGELCEYLQFGVWSKGIISRRLPRSRESFSLFLFNVFPGGKFGFSTSSNRSMIYRIGGLIDVGKAGLFFSLTLVRHESLGKSVLKCFSEFGLALG